MLHFLRTAASRTALSTGLRILFVSLSVIALVTISGCSSKPEKKRIEKVQPLSSGQTQRFHNRSDRKNEVVMQAMSLLDTDYKRGGNHPTSGMDCSGFVHFVFAQAWDVNLPRTSLAQSKVSAPLKIQGLEKGDLVFYNTRRRKFSHVGIYIGNNKFIHSPSPGGRVRVESMSMAYWKKRYNGARRVKDPGR